MTPGRALRIRRLVLLLLPREFRERYGGEMEAAFRQVLEEARERSGAWGVTLALLGELGDLVVAGVRLRTAEARSGRRGRRGGETMGDRVRDLRLAFRTLARRPGFAAVAAGTVALGVGAATAIFAVVEGVLLRPLPYPEPDRLVHVFQTNPELGWERGPVSFPNFHDWRTGAEIFESLSAYQMGLRRTLLVDGRPRQVRGSRVTGELFRTLGVPALHGRTLTPDDEGPGGARAMVLSHGLWQRAFGNDPGVVGREVVLGDETYTVAGVMPPEFPPLWRGGEFWVAFPFGPGSVERGTNFLTVVGRLKAGVTPGEAERYMEGLIRRIEAAHPEGNEKRSAHVETRAQVVTGHVESQLWLLMAAVGLLLAIACANLAGLMLVRGAGRSRELAVRSALGARRGRLIREIFTESLAVAALGAALAIPLARVFIQGVLALGPENLPRRGEIGLDPGGLAFGTGLALASALAFGLLPAIRSSGGDVQARLREVGGGVTGGSGASTLQRGLVVAQVALAVILVTGAGLLGRTLLELQAVDRGFDGDGVLTFRIHPPEGSYREARELDAFYQQVASELEALPGVSSVGATWALPFGESFASSRYMLEGRPDDESYLMQLIPIRGDYFRAMGIPVLRGRSFRPGDGRDGPLVTVVNQSFAERAWPGRSPLGRRLRKGSGDDAVLIEVVGVVPDVTMQSLAEEPAMQSFWPHAAAPWADELYFAVRTEGRDPLALVSSVRRAVASVDERVPVAEVSSMAGRIEAQLAGPRFRTVLVGGFAVTAAFLALLGIYGVTSFVVARRSHEIGVRMALGARRGRLRLRVLGQGAVLATGGAILGLAGAAAGSRVLESMLFRTETLNVPVYLGGALLILAATLLATWIPARRASSVDPARALRPE